MNFFDFDSFSQICPIFHHSPLFCAMRTDLSWKAINLWREHKNDGEWWKDRTNLWKAVKIKEIREKTPFLSNAEKSSPHQYNSCTLKVHLSFSSGWPEVVISVARTNSLKSIVPSLSLSKILNKCSIITEGSSCGKIWEYMATISGFRRTPSGHSSKKRLYQSLCNRLNFLD